MRITSFLNFDRIQEIIDKYENKGILKLHYIDLTDTSRFCCSRKLKRDFKKSNGNTIMHYKRFRKNL